MFMDKELITAQALAESLDLSVETIWRYTRENKIPYIELGNRQYRYKLEDVIRALSGNLVKEKSVPYETKPTKKLTYQDYLEIPEEPGYRFEILEGNLVKEPSPSTQHQRVLRELGQRLMNYFEHTDPEGELFFAPLDVTLTAANVLQPDILFVAGTRREIIRETCIDGPCDLIIEIMSPANRRKDRLQKLEIYRRAGIRHYWLADPGENTLEAFMLKEEHYTLVFAGGPGDKFAHPTFPGLDLNLDKIFHRPAQAT